MQFIQKACIWNLEYEYNIVYYNHIKIIQQTLIIEQEADNHTVSCFFYIIGVRYK